MCNSWILTLQVINDKTKKTCDLTKRAQEKLDTWTRKLTSKYANTTPPKPFIVSKQAPRPLQTGCSIPFIAPDPCTCLIPSSTKHKLHPLFITLAHIGWCWLHMKQTKVDFCNSSPLFGINKRNMRQEAEELINMKREYSRWKRRGEDPPV